MTARRGGVPALLLALLLLPQAAKADWPRFEAILWHDHGPQAREGAARLGVTAEMMLGQRGAVDAAALRLRAADLRAAGLGCYVENIATDFYAAYHRWRPDRPVTWAFDEVRALHRRDPADPAAWLRQPSLSDPGWRDAVAERLRAHVAALAPFAPLYYSLGDETGIADLAAAWDFDRSRASLGGMRAWLHGQYGTLTALNAEWGTHFARWDDVVPMGTDAAIARGDGNLSAWSDFKAWMDAAFASAVRAGTDAVHAADPAARAAIEGAQIPGWGGYDYTRLAGAVDVMEIYEGANNVEIAAALNPALVLLTNTGGGPTEAHEIWHAALLGTRGVILWDPDGAVVGTDGIPGPRGLALAPVLGALHGPVGRTLLASRAAYGPVGILYSPASERVRWLLDRRVDAARGLPNWSTRDAEAEWGDTAPRAARRRAVAALLQQGLTPRFLSADMLEHGVLAEAGVRVLVLPQALALSDAALAAIHSFAAAGGVVLADVPPGGYDAHGRARAALPALAGVRVLPGMAPDAVAAAVAAAGVPALVTLAAPDGRPVRDVEIRVRREGNNTLLGLLRAPPPAGAAAVEDVVLTLAAPRNVRDLLGSLPAMRTGRLLLRLDPERPALLLLSPSA